ncbi:MAG: hypothetical protein EA409_06735 [Saprospirales bacterium]|nr:MAG: hypothetical protein EA409_06735 [Saprospirales bacterium]
MKKGFKEQEFFKVINDLSIVDQGFIIVFWLIETENFNRSSPQFSYYIFAMDTSCYLRAEGFRY